MRRFAIAALGLFAVSACAHDPYGYGYGHGGGYGGYYGDQWSGNSGGDLSRPDPWLQNTREGQIILRRALGDGGYNPSAIRHLNIQFRRFADTNRDRRLTDREIRLALARCATHGWRW